MDDVRPFYRLADDFLVAFGELESMLVNQAGKRPYLELLHPINALFRLAGRQKTNLVPTLVQLLSEAFR